MSEAAIQAYQGQPFTVTLRAAGGTNYLWCLTALPEGVAFAALDHACVKSIPGGPVDTIFTFLAVKSGTVKIDFQLLCWSTPEKVADEVSIDVNIIPHNEADGLKGFTRYSDNAAFYNVPPYGYNGIATTVDKYGYPGCPEDPPVFKYGYPGCPEDPPILKYGYPGCPVIYPHVAYGYPGCVKYGYPGCQ